MQTAYDKAKNFLKTQFGNDGFTADQYHVYDAFSDEMYEAWANWDDEITKDYWEGQEKPEAPSASFRESYIDNMCDEELAPIIEAWGFEDFFYTAQITENDIRRDIESESAN